MHYKHFTVCISKIQPIVYDVNCSVSCHFYCHIQLERLLYGAQRDLLAIVKFLVVLAIGEISFAVIFVCLQIILAYRADVANIYKYLSI